ncbi:MAG: UDP-N-acetyl-D-galactosamine dehydrogenase [Mucilaginibacter sp.]|nr:UDP-N-acetyl-D-galactosamine dehydrogenase [Mucilaginibacter sp.]
MTSNLPKKRIGIIGLGYVGLPLAVEFARYYQVVGYDIKPSRIEQLNACYDATREISKEGLKSVLRGAADEKPGIYFTDDAQSLADCQVYIVTVPTPVDKYNRPDLTPLYRASETVGKVLKKEDIVIYESTVYPGVTEDECAPVLERISGLTFNKDFFCGYSPERINPGDKEHTVAKILKITSGSTPEAAQTVNELYKTIITAGTHLAPTIRTAEAAKVIENAQRDINIAFVNELAKIFNSLNIDTADVLEAAGTKWNFLKFKPGLVGGHCIGVDPYYLAQKAQEVGYHPEIILAGRRLNDGMGAYVAGETAKLMLDKAISINGSEVLILGFTFKENCPDVRNTRVIDIIQRLKSYHVNVCVYDPWANAQEVMDEYGIVCENAIPENRTFDAVIAAVAHDAFRDLNVMDYCKDKAVVYDIKGMLPLEIVDGRL